MSDVKGIPTSWFSFGCVGEVVEAMDDEAFLTIRGCQRHSRVTKFAGDGRTRMIRGYPVAVPTAMR